VRWWWTAPGKHVAPGIIDEHSHSAILGNVNECTNSVTCEVRIQDVINSESIQLYRQLAGGTTMQHLLHGSCNAIGGQCAVIKAKWGAPADELFYTKAPGTVKFALGENPKQANFGSDRTTRYPKTRAGVEQTIRDAFVRAQDYDRAFAEFRSGKRAVPPRRDLQLEALSEIVAGKRLIHCHSYRQDEILMLMRLTESFGFRVNTFTHILEGYKVADEMAVHGASALGFSDWWGYKQEVIDAIPVEQLPDVGPRPERGLQLRQRRTRAPAQHRSRQGDQVRRRAAGRSAQDGDAQSRQVAQDRPVGGLARGGQGRGLLDLERHPAVALLGLRADLDRGPQVLRSRRRSGRP
jgi:hypothetical protein